jgi:hypothetical protein
MRSRADIAYHSKLRRSGAAHGGRKPFPILILGRACAGGRTTVGERLIVKAGLPKGCNVPQHEELRTSSWWAAMSPYVGGCPLLGEERTTYAQGEFFAF